MPTRRERQLLDAIHRFCAECARRPAFESRCANADCELVAFAPKPMSTESERNRAAVAAYARRRRYYGEG